MHSVDQCPDIKLLNIGIRIAATAFVTVMVLGGWLIIDIIKKGGLRK